MNSLTFESLGPVTSTLWWPLEFSIKTGAQLPELTTTWFTAADSRPRAFPLRRLYVPWAKPEGAAPETNESRVIPEIAGGHWLRGRHVYSGSKVACAKCHTIRGEGGHVGPDLSNLVHRDYASVMRDISQPNVALNPDHLASIVELADGDALTGLLTSETASELTVVDASAAPRRVSRREVKSVRHASLSLMPEGLWELLTKEEQRDLMTFLLTVPLEPAPMEREGAPPPRKLAEVRALLDASTLNPEPGTRNPELRIVLCDGPKDHGKGEHDYPMWKKRWSTLLSLADGVTVDTAHIWPSKEQFAKAHLIAFFNNNPGWNDARAKELDAYLARGGGAAYFHWAVEARDQAPEFAKRIGLASNGGRLKFRHGPIDFVLTDHPLARGFTPASFTKENFIDETYWQWVGNPADVKLIASSIEDGQPQPQVWTREIGKGRVFVAIPGHYNWTFDDPIFRVLALRGLCWAAGQPPDRLAELATIGARLTGQ